MPVWIARLNFIKNSLKPFKRILTYNDNWYQTWKLSKWRTQRIRTAFLPMRWLPWRYVVFSSTPHTKCIDPWLFNLGRIAMRWLGLLLMHIVSGMNVPIKFMICKYRMSIFFFVISYLLTVQFSVFTISIHAMRWMTIHRLTIVMLILLGHVIHQDAFLAHGTGFRMFRLLERINQRK